MSKPRVKMNKWYIMGQKLFGEPEGHPNSELDGQEVRTSSIVAVETKNTIYDLGEPRTEARKDTVQLVDENTSPV